MTEKQSKFDRLRAQRIIDEYDLDTMCREHANRHDDIADEHALAVSRVAAAKDALEDYLSDATQRARLELAALKAGTGPAGRVTDKQVDEAVRGDSRYGQLRLALRRCEREALRWAGMRESSRERGFMLRILSDREVAGVTAKRTAQPTRKMRERLARGE